MWVQPVEYGNQWVHYPGCSFLQANNFFVIDSDTFMDFNNVSNLLYIMCY